MGVLNLMSWEDKFRSWSQPPSQAEQEKCENAERAIRRAIDDDKTLSTKDIEVKAQGSYKANTNIRLDSDVDIRVCLKNTFYYSLPQNSSQRPEDYGIVPVTTSYADFKQQVENALVNEFGRRSVTRGNKAFDIHENTYRIDADVVAVYEYRWYTGRYNPDGSHHYHEGVKFYSDSGDLILNWPEQSYTNGVTKNNATGRRYKANVRILKRLRNEMQEAGIADADEIASFLIESLVWNAPDEAFGHDKLKDDVRYVLAHCFNHTLDDQKCKEWGEVNELKYLFRSAQPWTRQQAHKFLSAAWDYIGFE